MFTKPVCITTTTTAMTNNIIELKFNSLGNLSINLKFKITKIIRNPTNKFVVDFLLFPFI